MRSREIEAIIMVVKARLSLAPDDSKLCGHSSCSFGSGYTGAVTNTKDVWEPFNWTDKLLWIECGYQRSPVVLQGLLVDIKEACGIR